MCLKKEELVHFGGGGRSGEGGERGVRWEGVERGDVRWGGWEEGGCEMRRVGEGGRGWV